MFQKVSFEWDISILKSNFGCYTDPSEISIYHAGGVSEKSNSKF